MMAPSLFLIAVGAILMVAVTTEVQGVNLDMVGLILVAVGAVGFLWAAVMHMRENGWHRDEEI